MIEATSSGCSPAYAWLPPATMIMRAPGIRAASSCATAGGLIGSASLQRRSVGARPDPGEASGEVGPVVDEPGRHIGERRPVVVTPLGHAEPRDIDAAGRRDEDEACDAFWALERQARGEDSAHRLGDDMARSRRELLDQPAEKVIERIDSRIAGDAVQ